MNAKQAVGFEERGFFKEEAKHIPLTCHEILFYFLYGICQDHPQPET